MSVSVWRCKVELLCVMCGTPLNLDGCWVTRYPRDPHYCIVVVNIQPGAIDCLAYRSPYSWSDGAWSAWFSIGEEDLINMAKKMVNFSCTPDSGHPSFLDALASLEMVLPVTNFFFVRYRINQ